MQDDRRPPGMRRRSRHVDRQRDAAADVDRRMRRARDRCPTSSGGSSRARWRRRRRRAAPACTVSSRKNAAVKAAAPIGIQLGPVSCSTYCGRASSGRADDRLAAAGRRARQVVAAGFDFLREPGLLPQRLAARHLRECCASDTRRSAATPACRHSRRCPRDRSIAKRKLRARSIRNSATPAAIMKAPIVETRFSASQPRPAGIRVHAARHAGESGDVHREERDVDADEHQPEHPAAEPLGQRVAC